jgi:hypothetical protein
LAIDRKKTKVVKNLPIPKSLKELRGFLGLVSYYKNFIRRFGVISKPLINLLKKNNFRWHDKA